MFYSDKAKLVWIRVPKTGSTTVYHTLRAALPDLTSDGDPHEFMETLQERRGDAFAHYHHMGFVRWPLDWLNSMHASLAHPNNRFSRMHCVGGSKTKTPREFLDAIEHTPYDWFTVNGAVKVPEIYRTEDMSEFCNSVGQEARVINRTPDATRVELEWTRDDLHAIATKFARELAHYPERKLI
jgi:hypothetical protein